jgi:hypothetical protein
MSTISTGISPPYDGDHILYADTIFVAARQEKTNRGCVAYANSGSRSLFRAHQEKAADVS